MPFIPYLYFNGNAEEVLEFYRRGLGGEVAIVRFEGTPAAPHVPPDWSHKVLHGTLTAPAGTVCIMDAPPGRGAEPGGNFAISIQTDDEAQIDAIFAHLAAGGTVKMPLEKTFWSKKFGMLADKFGTSWMLSCQ